MAGVVLPGFAPKIHIPSTRLYVPTVAHIFPSGNEGGNVIYCGLKVDTNGDMYRIDVDTSDNSIRYTFWYNILNRRLPARIPSDLQVKASDQKDTINDGANASFWLEGYHYDTAYHRDIESGDIGNLDSWVDLSSGPYEWYAERNESSVYFAGRQARLRVEFQSATLGWSALYDIRCVLSWSNPTDPLPPPIDIMPETR